MARLGRGFSHHQWYVTFLKDVPNLTADSGIVSEGLTDTNNSQSNADSGIGMEQLSAISLVTSDVVI